MAERSVSYRQAYDQGFSDAICNEDNSSGMWAETDSERDWMDGYYEGHVAGESARLANPGHRD